MSVLQSLFKKYRNRSARAGNIHMSDAGFGLPISTDDVHDSVITDQQCDDAFGTPAVVGAGFMGIVDDAGGSDHIFICVSDGTKWAWTLMTIAA